MKVPRLDFEKRATHAREAIGNDSEQHLGVQGAATAALCGRLAAGLRGPGETELKTWSAKLTVLLRDDQERLLMAAGFRRVHFFGGYDFGPYDKAVSNQLITVANE